jgi:dTMP kinase
MLITFEGIEGSGKSTQVKCLKDWLQHQNIPCVLTREPGGTDIGAHIRRILLDPNNTAMSPMTELLLYMADRAQHLSELIRPEMAHNKIILCDRFFDATTVYQGIARQIDMETIIKLHNIVLDGLRPTKTLLFDLPVEQGLERAWKRIHADQTEQNENRFEKESIHFHQEVRQGYLDLAKNEPDRFIIVNAGQSEKRVFEDVVSIFEFEGLVREFLTLRSV